MLPKLSASGSSFCWTWLLCVFSSWAKSSSFLTTWRKHKHWKFVTYHFGKRGSEISTQVPAALHEWVDALWTVPRLRQSLPVRNGLCCLSARQPAVWLLSKSKHLPQKYSKTAAMWEDFQIRRTALNLQTSDLLVAIPVKTSGALHLTENAIRYVRSSMMYLLGILDVVAL